MQSDELYELLKCEFQKMISENELEAENVRIHAKSLSPEEAIGVTERKDFPILTGKEVMLLASCKGYLGQAFTDASSLYEGNLKEVTEMDIVGDQYARAIFVACLNAVSGYLGKSDKTIHCKNDGPENCARHAVTYLKEIYGNPKIALVGYQPALLEHLAMEFQVRVMDLNEDNVGQERYGVIVEHGIEDKEKVIEWADLILCTGSTLCNNTICDYLNLNKEVLFFGTTISGAAPILGAKRLCFTEENCRITEE